MNIALLSFATEPPHDPLGEEVGQRLQAAGAGLVRESLRPDLGRLAGLLTAGLSDPRFQAILVVADLPGSGNHQLVANIEVRLQPPLASWNSLVSHLLWPELGSQLLWSPTCLGRNQGRLVAALTGAPQQVNQMMDQLLLPQLPRLLEWARG